MDDVKEYIKSKFGTYAKLAKVLGLVEGTVKNAVNKNDDVSWLNLLKHQRNNVLTESQLNILETALQNELSTIEDNDTFLRYGQSKKDARKDLNVLLFHFSNDT